MRPNITVVDVGAGLKSLYAAWLKQYQTMVIHAIEPHPELANRLRTFIQENVDASYLTRGRVLIDECAMIDDPKKQTVELHLSNDLTSSSTLPFRKDSIRKWKYPIGRKLFANVGTATVRCATLTHWMKQHKVSRVDLLNIDVQGNAMEVLRGLEDSTTWDKIKELNVKVHAIDFELYAGQTLGPDVLQLCQRHYFTLKHHSKKTRGQEDVFGFHSELVLAKKIPLLGLSKKAMASSA